MRLLVLVLLVLLELLELLELLALLALGALLLFGGGEPALAPRCKCVSGFSSELSSGSAGFVLFGPAFLVALRGL